MKKTIVPLLCGALLLSGCQKTGPSSTSSGSAPTDSEPVPVIDTAALFSDRDLDGSYDENTAVRIHVEGESAACDSDAVSLSGSRITLLDEGTYLVDGTLTDGQIMVDADDTDKVQIVLAGADITCADSAAIYSKNADKVFLTLAEGTENTLTNGGGYIAIDENNIDAVVFSKTDLTLNGSGSLTIDAQAGHGVVSKDELTVTGGSYTVTAAEHGMTGKDSLAVAGGRFTITSGKDGLHAENTDDSALGFLYVADGEFTIIAQGDAVSASGAMQTDGGTFDLTTGEGSASVTMPAEDSFAPGGRGGGPGRGDGSRPQGEQPAEGETPPERPASSDGGQPLEFPIQPAGEEPASTAETAEMTDTAEDTVSQKGMKAEGTLTINGGTFTMDSADDCIHSGGALTVTNGTFTLSSGDDAIHSDDAVTIQSGEFSIPYCYEGVEGLAVTVEGGTFDVTAHDDGFNAAGGADSSGFGGRGEQFAASEDSFITVNGGTITIVSDGDCLDSNGDLTVNGGTLDLTCNGSGNTTLDCNGTYTNDGGDVTTNDGAESNPGGMGGGRPGGKQAPPAQETPSA
nr:carbohydrate-binding domain-containing protein [uncultured Dysosmobacter sp.]